MNHSALRRAKSGDKVLEIKNLSVAYGQRTVVEDVSFRVLAGETVSIVGESGSGKSTILRAVQGLLGSEGRIVSGSITFDGVSLPDLKPDEMRRYRGGVIATVPQQAGLSMDPITRIGRQFCEAIRTQRKITQNESDARACECMRSLSLKEPEKILRSYPAMLSGGTNQRVALALAMVMEPRLILADEPTSALDVTVQVEVVRSMLELKRQSDAAILMVTHNMGVVAQMSDHVGVMYNGRLLEWGTRDGVLHTPRHPYTRALMASVLKMDGSVPDVKTVYREAAEGGCIYYSRCPFAEDGCRAAQKTIDADGHMVMCCRAGEVTANA